MHFKVFAFICLFLFCCSRVVVQAQNINARNIPNFLRFEFIEINHIVGYARFGNGNGLDEYEYDEVAGYGKLNVREQGSQLEFDGSFLFGDYFYHFYPEHINKVFNYTTQSIIILLDGENYNFVSARFDLMSGESYGDNIIRNNDFTEYTVELNVHIDYTLFVRWLAFKNGDRNSTIRGIRNYYSHIINGVNTNYQRINRPDFSMNIFLKNFYIETTESIYTNDSTLITRNALNIDSDEALSKALNWSTNRQGFTADAHIFFGNLEMNDVLGIAFMSSVCQNNAVTVIKHNNQQEITNTVTHELGHILGSPHDNSNLAACSPHRLFLMSSSLSDFNEANRLNTFRFSSCSIQYFIFNFEILDRNNQNCLVNNIAQNEDIHSEDQLIGQRYTLDRQCQMFNGPLSTNCGGDVCSSLYCLEPTTQRCTRSFRRTAANGTHCGNRKMCLDGTCQFNENAPASQKENCLYGDFMGSLWIIRRNLRCSQLTNRNAGVCGFSRVKSICCDSCPRFYNSENTECPYGDADEHCQSVETFPNLCRLRSTNNFCCDTCPRIYSENDRGTLEPRNANATCRDLIQCDAFEANLCYYSSYEQDCCFTCSSIRSTRSGCEYGNRIHTCEGLGCSRYCCSNCTDEELKNLNTTII